MCSEAVTRRCQLSRRAVAVLFTATVGNTVRHLNASTRQRRRTVLAALIACCVVVIGANGAMAGAEPGHPHAIHVHAASGAHGATTLPVEHPHISDGGAQCSPEYVAEAVLPRGGTSMPAMGLVTVVAMLLTLWGQLAPSAIRGPPRPITQTLFGRLLLDRLCISRR